MEASSFEETSYHSKVRLSRSEFVQVYDNLSFIKGYFKLLKNIISQQTTYDVDLNKTFNGKKTITVQLNCNHVVSMENTKKIRCGKSCNISVKKIDVVGDEDVVFDFTAKCKHRNGNYLIIVFN